MHLTIRQRILGSYALIMAIMLIMGGIVYAHLRAVTRETTNVEEFSVPALYYVTQMLNAFNEDYAITQEFGLEQNPATIPPLVREVQESRARTLSLTKKYVATITDADEQAQYEAYEKDRIPYLRIQDQVLKLATDPRNSHQIAATVREDLDPEYDKIRTLLSELVDRNKGEADTSTQLIAASVAQAREAILMSFAMALLLSIACIYYLLRSITRPLDGLVTAMGRMRQGDFTQRIDRQDEFGALGQAFNGMADDLASLFGEVQKSGIRVTSSVTEIAATAREQQTTANEIAVTTTEIGATSREISATSRELVKTMRDVSLVGEQTAALAGDGQTGLARMEETMRRARSTRSSACSMRRQATSIRWSAPSPKWRTKRICCRSMRRSRPKRPANTAVDSRWSPLRSADWRTRQLWPRTTSSRWSRRSIQPCPPASWAWTSFRRKCAAA